MTVRLVALPPNDFRSAWDYFKQNLLNILTKGEESWIPEDIFLEVMTGRSAAFLVEADGAVSGGMVTTARGETLHVWVLWDTSGHLQDIFEEVRQMAKAAGFRYGSFETRRRGWDKVAPKLGFRPRTWIQEV